MDVEKLLRYCIERLIDKPEALVITKTESPEKTVLEVKVDTSDRARIIGRQGATFKTLRALVSVVGQERPYDLVIEAKD